MITLYEVGKSVMGDASSPPYNLEELCTSNNISMWAKWKPVRFEKVGILTDDERKRIGYGLKSVGPDIGCSGHLGTSESGILDWAEESFQSYIDNNGEDVIWDKPTNYFRLTDFANQDMSDRYYGSEQATYYINTHDTYSPTFRYNSANSSGSITLEDLKEFLGMDYTDINYMEIVVVYRVNSGTCKIVSTGKTVLELQEDGGNASFSVKYQDNSLYEGFFAAITPLDETGLSSWDMALSNDQESCSAEIVRFPNSYFKGTTDFSQPEEGLPSIWFNTDQYDTEYSTTNSNACIYYDGGVLTVRLMLQLPKSIDEYDLDFKVIVYAKASENSSDYNHDWSSEFEEEIDVEYCYTTTVVIAGDLSEYISDSLMKIEYKVGNKTYWVGLTNHTVLTTDPGYTKISNIHGM